VFRVKHSFRARIRPSLSSPALNGFGLMASVPTLALTQHAWRERPIQPAEPDAIVRNGREKNMTVSSEDAGMLQGGLMPQKLSDAMREVLGGWHYDLPQSWQSVLKQVALDFVGMDDGLQIAPWEPIFPARKGKLSPGAPRARMRCVPLMSFALRPLRAVLLGQDAWSEPASATGRAFGIGAVRAWRDLDRMFPASVRASTQSLMAARFARPDLARRSVDWPALLELIETGQLDVEPHAGIADRHEAQGVLLLNASLTVSRFRRDIDPHQARGHMPLWRPAMLAVLRHVAKAGHPVGFRGFGATAEDLFREAGLNDDPRHGGFNRPRPAYADAFLALPNPFCGRERASGAGCCIRDRLVMP